MEAIRAFLAVPEYAYLVIFGLSILVYKLGFQERKLPVLKAFLVYVVLAVACVPVTTLYMFGLPVLEVLLAGGVILLVVRLRRKQSEKQTEKKETGQEVKGAGGERK